MLIGPILPAMTREGMVEPPGIAPGSSPVITRAFMSIARASPNPFNIGAIGCRGKDGDRSIVPIPGLRQKGQVRRTPLSEAGGGGGALYRFNLLKA